MRFKYYLRSLFPACIVIIAIFGFSSDAAADFYMWPDNDPGTGGSWQDVAIDADGSHIIVGSTNGLFLSTDEGTTWESIVPAPGYGDVVAISGDGLTVITTDGSRLQLSQDGGDTWGETQPIGDTDASTWSMLEVDADGSVLIAGISGGRLYMSEDGGDTWSETRPIDDGDYGWADIDLDSDGSHLIAAVDGGRLYISDDGGDTWSETQPIDDSGYGWNSVALDADGSNLFVSYAQPGPKGGTVGRLYISDDGGDTWTETQPVDIDGHGWTHVAMDSDGSALMAAVGGERVHTSFDGGLSWSETQPAGDTARDVWVFDLDSDGSHVALVESYTTIGVFYEAHVGFAIPYIESVSPVAGETDVAVDSDLSFSFNADVNINEGGIDIYRAEDDILIESINVTSDQVVGDGTDTIIVNPTNDLEGGVEYYVLIEVGAFQDVLNTFDFVGLNDPTTWSFTTVAAPVEEEPAEESSGGGGSSSSHRRSSNTGNSSDTPAPVITPPTSAAPAGSIESLMQQLVVLLTQLLEQLLAERQ